MEFCRRRHFLCKEIGDHFHAELPPVHVVAEEEEVGGHQLGPHPPEDLLEAHKVAEVTVKVT